MSPKIKLQKAITAYSAILDELNQNGAKHITYAHAGSFINDLSSMEELTVESFLGKLHEQLQQHTLFAMACSSGHMKAILRSASPTSSPEHQNNVYMCQERANGCEPPSEEILPAPSATLPHEPKIATEINVLQTELEAVENLNGVVNSADGAVSGMELDVVQNNARAEEPASMPADTAPSRHLFNARDFLVKKLAEYRANPEKWTWVKLDPDGDNTFILKNFLVVVDENGQLLDDPAKGGWDPNQEIYLQSSKERNYPCYQEERPLLNDKHEALYRNAPFFRAFATPATDAGDEFGASSSKAIKDCSYPVFTVETSDGTDMQLRLMVMVVKASWHTRNENPQGLFDFDGVWPQVLDGLQGKPVYLKIRLSSVKMCYYYGGCYTAESMWPIPPPRDDAVEENSAKRQRKVTARHPPNIAEYEKAYSQRENSIKYALPQTAGGWIRQVLSPQCVGDRHSGVFSPTENFGMLRLDFLAIYKLKDSDKSVSIMIECDENQGHQHKNSVQELERAVKVAKNMSKFLSSNLPVFLRINPDACAEFGGHIKVKDYELQIEKMIEHICMQAQLIDVVNGTSELPIYYLFFPDGHRYKDFPRGYQVPRDYVHEQGSIIKYRLLIIRDGEKVGEGGIDWK